MREPRQPDDQVAQAFDVARRHAAHAFEHLVSAQFIDHRARVGRRYRRHAITHVAQHLNVDTAQSCRNDRTKHRIADNAQHHFNTWRHHFLHQHAIDACVRRVASGRFHNLHVAAMHRIVALQAQPDRTGIGLMRNVGRIDFERHLAGELPRMGDRLFRLAGEPFARDGKSVFGEHEFRFPLRQRSGVRAELVARRLHRNAGRPLRHIRLLLVSSDALAEIHRCAQRPQAWQRIAVDRHTQSNQIFGGWRRIICACADPDHGRRLRTIEHELHAAFDLLAGHERENRCDCVYVRVARYRIQRAAEHRGFAGGERRKIAGIEYLAAVTGQHAGQHCLRLCRVFSPVYALIGAHIGEMHDVAAGRSDRRCTATLGPTAFTQKDRCLVKLAAGVHAYHAVLFECGLIDIVNSSDGAGVRCRRTAARFGAAQLQYDYRLFTLQSLQRHRLQFGAILEAFDCHQDDVGGVGAQHETREVERVEVRFIAAARFVAHAQPCHLRAPHHGDLAEPAAVADNADIARLAFGAADSAGGRHREIIDEVDYAVAIGAHDAHAGRARERDQPCLPLAAFGRGGLRESRGIYSGERHA